MGFPATTGASFLPYLITDPVVAPESCRHCYSENLALMPNCYFVNDYKGAHMVRPACACCLGKWADSVPQMSFAVSPADQRVICSS